MLSMLLTACSTPVDTPRVGQQVEPSPASAEVQTEVQAEVQPVTAAVAAQADRTATRPNILFILVDDMGVNDLGRSGNSAVKTPHLDAFARQSLVFTRHYTDSTCQATRVGVLTGLAPAELGFRPGNIGISAQVNTLPELLKSAGYTTHHIGKWHLGFATKLAWPTNQGFDTFFGFLNQALLAGSYGNGKWRLARPSYHNPLLQEDDNPPQKYHGHLSAILTQRAVDFVASRKKGDAPWFLNLWTYAPHTPLQPMAEYARRYPDTPRGKYLASLEQVDANIGRVLTALQAAGLDQNTLVIIASDNGGTGHEVNSNYPYKGGKATFQEGGVRTPMMMRWPGHLPAGRTTDLLVSYLDYLPTLAAVAGAAPPANLAGLDMLAADTGEHRLRDNLYWEVNSSAASTWAALSGDGRWRLFQYFYGKPALYDLQNNPAGDVNVLPQYPQIAQKLLEDYVAWHEDKRKIRLSYQRLSGNGRAVVDGQALQRTPGYRGRTFMVAVEPSPPLSVSAAGAHESGDEQTLVFQKNQWRLRQQAGRLLLDLNAVHMSAPAPLPGVCSTVAVTSYFLQSAVQLKKWTTDLGLYINGELVASKHLDSATLPVDDFEQPTYIGQDDKGQNTYDGKIGEPRWFNERLAGKPSGRFGQASTLVDEQSDLCAMLHPQPGSVSEPGA